MTKNKYAAILLVLAVFAASCALAAGAPDASRAVYVNITYQDGETALKGAQFDLYLLAQQDEEGHWKPTRAFELYDLALDDTAQWTTLASVLEGYVLRDALIPVQSGETNTNGFLRLPDDDKALKHGLYLLIGRTHMQNNTNYYALPAIVQLPYLAQEPNVWQYEISVKPKHESGTIPPQPLYTERKVLKVWEDEGYENKRPSEVIVQLLCDGEVVQTATLNEQNLWRWTWENLEAHHRWMVVEKKVEGYTSTVTQVGTTFKLTNTYQVPAPTPTPSISPETTPTPTPSISPETTPTPTPKPTPTPNRQETLPQTGQLWWPVPVLICCGLVLIILGLLRRRSEDYEM